MTTLDTNAPVTAPATTTAPTERRNRSTGHTPASVQLLNRILDWFTLTRHADYGLAVMRMVSGFLVVGWLVLNIPVAARVWGPGSAYWEPYRAVLGYQWHLDLLRHAGSSAFVLWYATTLVLAAAFTVGWRTRIVTPLLFVFYAGINAQNVAIADGGNYFFRIMLIYLIFADVSRRWSFDSRRRSRKNLSEAASGTVLHNLALCLVVAQLCLVYLEAGLYKVQGPLWQNGTAMYYPLASDFYGVFPGLSAIATHWSWAVVGVTYFSVLIQISFTFLLFNKLTRRLVLVGIICLHLGIAVMMGLPFFSGMMASADVVLVSGPTWVLVVGGLSRGARSLWRRILGRFRTAT